LNFEGLVVVNSLFSFLEAIERRLRIAELIVMSCPVGIDGKGSVTVLIWFHFASSLTESELKRCEHCRSDNML